MKNTTNTPYRLTPAELAVLVSTTAEIVESCQRTTAATAAALRDPVEKLEDHKLEDHSK